MFVCLNTNHLFVFYICLNSVKKYYRSIYYDNKSYEQTGLMSDIISVVALEYKTGVIALLLALSFLNLTSHPISSMNIR